MTQVIDGKSLSQTIKEELKLQVANRISAGKKKPHLAAVLVGNDGASETYVGSKVKSCEMVGFDSTLVRLPDTTTEEALLLEINQLNNNDAIDGFIVQLPLPKHIDDQRIINAIAPEKDVDGFTPINIGNMVLGDDDAFTPATPLGILTMLERHNITTKGKHCVVIGRSNIVGRPMSVLMSRSAPVGNSTVTICHRHTENLASFTKQADILIVAIGKPGFITAEMIKEGAVIIDVGITRIPDSSKKRGFRLSGDVDYQDVFEKCAAITPVPGGVGPMTVTSLLLNTFKACALKD